MNSVTVVGVPGGDYECFCIDVTAKEFERIKGEKPTKYDKSLDKKKYRIYPNDLMYKMGAEDGKKYEITLTMKEI